MWTGLFPGPIYDEKSKNKKKLQLVLTTNYLTTITRFLKKTAKK